MTITIKPSYFYNLYSPSLCELRLYLNYIGMEPSPLSAFAEILIQLGLRHEKNHIASFPIISDLTYSTSDTTLEEIRKESPVIYQGKLKFQAQIDGVNIEVIGIPDFMLKEPAGYVIRDCKLARHVSESKHKEILQQLQVYGWLLEKTTGKKPMKLEVLKGDGAIELLDYANEDTIISYMRTLLDSISLSEEPYSSVGWSKCGGCGYYDYCMPRAQKNQDIALVYDLDQNLAKRLRELDVITIQELVSRFDEKSLSELKRPWGAREQKVGKKAGRIILQARAMIEKREIVLKKPELPLSANYVMFDLEGLPPQLDEFDKIYLWGMQIFGEKPSEFLYSLAETGTDGD